MTRIIKDYSEVSLNPEDLDGKIDFSHIFGRTAPVHIEIGSGKGTFLVSGAGAEPDINFLGIEWARKYYRLAVDRLGRWPCFAVAQRLARLPGRPAGQNFGLLRRRPTAAIPG